MKFYGCMHPPAKNRLSLYFHSKLKAALLNEWCCSCLSGKFDYIRSLSVARRVTSDIDDALLYKPRMKFIMIRIYQLIGENSLKENHRAIVFLFASV